MSINILMDRAQEPDDELVRGSLGATWPFFEELRAATAACEHDWKHHGKKYGWKLKVHAGGKNVLELTVAAGWFLVAMAIRETERRDLAADSAAAAAPEGYGIKIEVRDRASCERAKALVASIVATRGLAR
jgi:hypothetical protein